MTFLDLDKNSLLADTRASVEQELRQASASQHETQAGATHEESKAENDKDTRAIEATYLARGLAQRVVELENALTALSFVPLRAFHADSPIAVSALLELEDSDGGCKLYFILPAGAGVRLSQNGQKITVVTPPSPIGTALVGQRLDDDISLITPAGRRTCTITKLR